MSRRTVVKEYRRRGEKATTPILSEAPRPIMTPRIDTASSTATFNDRQAEPEPWLSGSTFQHPVPQHGDPWETCVERLRTHDSELCDGWREEVGNLLIFAGLFSATVTAFIIESYQQLSQDPMELNNWLLKQLLIETHNANTQDPAARNATLPPFPAFAPSATDIRVNVCWFMSLALSLGTVLIGILCTQWLREYERDPPLDPKEAIPLRHLRYDGLIEWKVPEIVTVLPVMFHTSLVLFFTGLIDLLWSLNLTVAICVSFIASVLFLFIVATTALPTLQMLFVRDPWLRTPQCPYKSAQSWTCYRIIVFILKLLPLRFRLGDVIFSSSTESGKKPFIDDGNWVDFDMCWKAARAQAQAQAPPKIPPNNVTHWENRSKSDLVEGLVWMEKNLGQNAEVIHTMYHCLRDLPPNIAISVVAELGSEVKKHLIPSIAHTGSYSMHTPNMSDSEWRDTLSALYLELKSGAFSGFEKFQAEAIVRTLNSRIEKIHRRPLSTDLTTISDYMPFVHWPERTLHGLSGELGTQFLHCMKGLVTLEQTNDDIDKKIWDHIRHILSRPSSDDTNAQHDIQVQLAFDIMLAYEWRLPKTIQSDDDIEQERNFREKVCTSVRCIIHVFPAGELRGLSAERRRRAQMVIIAAQRRMEHMGGVDRILLNPGLRRQWDKIMSVVRGDGDDMYLLSPTDFRSNTWDLELQ